MPCGYHGSQNYGRPTAKMNRLGDLSSIHRGIEYNQPLRTSKSPLIASDELPGFMPGVHTVKDTVEPFVVRKTVFLNVSPNLMRTLAYNLPWHKPKLIVNANQQSRGPWKITASLDNVGRVCYQNFHGIWPAISLRMEVLAAVLNGPVAHAFIGTREGKRHVHIQTLKDIPVPEFDQTQQQIIASMVRQYSDARGLWLSGELVADEAHERCSQLLRLIDAEVLKAYDLSPRTERQLLDFFVGHRRLGPVEFTEYLPQDFKPYIPWHMYISKQFKEASAKSTLNRLPVIPASPLIDEALSYIE